MYQIQFGTVFIIYNISDEHKHEKKVLQKATFLQLLTVSGIKKNHLVLALDEISCYDQRK